MQDTLRALRGLQELDRDIYRVDQEVKRLPRERARRRAEIDQKIERRQAIEREIREERAKLKEIEDHTTLQRQRLRKLEHEAGLSRADAALLAAYQHEMRTLKRDIGDAEEEGLKRVEVIEQLEKACGDLQAGVDEEERVFEEFRIQLERELAEAQERLSQLVEERTKRLSGAIPPAVLSQYEKLLAAREGMAMAELEGRVCQGCYMEVPPNVYVRIARGQEIVECPNCTRILYLAPR
jgi:hypothetical protein